MALESSIKAGIREGKYILYMDEEVDKLRKEIWKTIFAEKGDLSISDINLALVSYELIHHSDEKEGGLKNG